MTVIQGEYKLTRSSRRCSIEDRPLVPGEWYFSVVSESDNDDESLNRCDISAQAWQGPPEGTLGWWKTRMPAAGARKLKLAPDPVLIDLMKQSESIEDGPLRFLFALMLMRRRLIQAIDAPKTEDSSDDSLMWLEYVGDGAQFCITRHRISTSEAKRLGDALVDLLYCDAE